jgi:hypothetical protein
MDLSGVLSHSQNTVTRGDVWESDEDAVGDLKPFTNSTDFFHLNARPGVPVERDGPGDWKGY